MTQPSLRVRRLALAVMLAAPATAVAQVPTEDAAVATKPTATSLATGREYSARFLAGDLDALWAKFAPPMKAAMKNDPATLKSFREQVVGQLGKEKELVAEDVRPAGEFDLYARTVRFEKAPQQRFVIQWAVAKDGTIGGFFVKAAPEAAPSPNLAYQTKTALQLPVDGDWYIVWGGRTLDNNYHAVDAEQRFAIDMLVKRDGRTHADSTTALTGYYCFGQPVYAPGDGIVSKIVDGNPDNPIGTVDARNPAGNHVVIDHGNGEFSILAHLQYASIRVKTGDKVKQGDQIGACGNSGNTSEPHLHYQLQDQAAMFSGAHGLPAQFADYVADGQLVPRGEPVRGQTVRRATDADRNVGAAKAPTTPARKPAAKPVKP